MIIDEMIYYFDIGKNYQLINEIILILKNKIYEKNLKSIIFFFENFQKDNRKWNKLLPDEYKYLSESNIEGIYQIISAKHQNIFLIISQNLNIIKILKKIINLKIK